MDNSWAIPWPKFRENKMKTYQEFITEVTLSAEQKAAIEEAKNPKVTYKVNSKGVFDGLVQDPELKKALSKTNAYFAPKFNAAGVLIGLDVFNSKGVLSSAFGYAANKITKAAWESNTKQAQKPRV